MRVKICGITNLEDALHASYAGADALGFVFYEKSPRYIAPAEAREIIRQLPPFVMSVALFVEVDAQTINEAMRISGAAVAQLHWDAPKEVVREVERPILPVVRVRSADDLKKIEGFALLDPHVPEYGGSGQRIPMEWFDGIDCSRFVLAGGMRPENVHEARALGFWGVDVSSGVEMRQGKKDPDKVRCLILNAKGV
ncbi:MAG: phosphoribosylanthranilate isomerase [Campylobacterales bacterium]